MLYRIVWRLRRNARAHDVSTCHNEKLLPRTRWRRAMAQRKRSNICNQHGGGISMKIINENMAAS